MLLTNQEEATGNGDKSETRRGSAHVTPQVLTPKPQVLGLPWVFRGQTARPDPLPSCACLIAHVTGYWWGNMAPSLRGLRPDRREKRPHLDRGGRDTRKNGGRPAGGRDCPPKSWQPECRISSECSEGSYGGPCTPAHRVERSVLRGRRGAGDLAHRWATGAGSGGL